MSDKLAHLVTSGDSVVVGPKTADELRRFIAAEPVLDMPTEEDWDGTLSSLSLGTSGKRFSLTETATQRKLFERALAGIPARDIARGVTDWLREQTFMPTPAELRKYALRTKARREYAVSRARYLVGLHEREWEPPLADEDRPTPEEMAAIKAQLADQYPSQREEKA